MTYPNDHIGQGRSEERQDENARIVNRLSVVVMVLVLIVGVLFVA